MKKEGHRPSFFCRNAPAEDYRIKAELVKTLNISAQ